MTPSCVLGYLQENATMNTKSKYNIFFYLVLNANFSHKTKVLWYINYD